MLQTRLCHIFKIQYPIILGGMAFAGDHRLAAAVSEAGGLGVIASGNLTIDDLAEQITAYRKKTDKPLGVNCFIKDTECREKADLACRMGVSAIFTGIGNPAPVMEFGKKAGIPVIPTVATVRHALAAIESGSGIIVAEGQEGGGHIGRIGTLPLISQVRKAVGDRVPIIAAGGIGDGSQMIACLVLGATGVMMGTRFLTALECPIHDNVKEALIRSGIDDTTVTGQFTGLPMRCLKNQFTSEYQKKEKAVPSYEMLMFGKGKIREGLMGGDVNNGSLPAGQVIGQLEMIQSAGEIIRSIVAEAEDISRKITENAGFENW